MFPSPRTSSLHGIMATRTPAQRKVLIWLVRRHGALGFHGFDCTQTYTCTDFVKQSFSDLHHIICDQA